ncbi:MAG: SMP-30/gluconolactonase/LRE family protein [Planctomycetota bacterium]|nr:SMP-30/gluconolactonase/LRE family protein [Planctomycetota bacterium]
MRFRLSFIVASIFFFVPIGATLQSQAQAPKRTLGTIERFDSQLDKLLAPEAKLEILADGFTWTEGPVWMGDATNGHLLFSDIPRNSIFKWTAKNGIQLFMNPSGYTGVTFYGLEPGSNGLLKDLDGNLVLCEHGDRRVSVLTPGGGKRTLADNYQGKRLNSPNDAALRSNGDLYFTDPPYGLPSRENDPRRELDHFGVYRISKKDGSLTLLTTELARPNGIGFSPDEKTLYVAQSDPKNAIWMSFAVQADGTLSKGTLFYDATKEVGKMPGLPDGLSVDTQGNLWASGPGGIWIFSKEAKLLGRINTGERTSNCAFGEDGTTLFVTADSYLCRVATKAKGMP